MWQAMSGVPAITAARDIQSRFGSLPGEPMMKVSMLLVAAAAISSMMAWVGAGSPGIPVPTHCSANVGTPSVINNTKRRPTWAVVLMLFSTAYL